MTFRGTFKVKCQIMYLLVNVYPLKRLYVAIKTSHVHKSNDVEGTG